MLTKFDEMTCHQAVSTFDHPDTSDRAFTEKMWFNIHDRTGDVRIAAGIGVYPNRNVMDGFGIVALGGAQRNLRASRELRPRFDDLTIGPVHVEVREPFRRVHVALGENPQGFSFDLEFVGTLPPHEEAPQYGRQHGRVFMNTCRYAQMGRARGVVRIDGRTIDLREDDTYAQRDHSWGIRMGVGQPEPGIYSTDIAPFAGMMINWLTAQFDKWGVYYYLIERADGKVALISGGVVPTLGEPGKEVPVVKVDHDFQYHERSLRMRSGTVVIHAADGRKIELAMRELGTMYLRGGGYVGYKGFTHGTFMGPSWSDGETWEVGDPKIADEVHGLDDTICEYRSGGEVGYGIIENMILPPFPRYGFDFGRRG